MKKRNIVIILIAIIVVLLIIFKLNSHQNETKEENVTTNVIDQNDKNVINQIKNEINATADSDMYQIEEEYDGRQIIQIKPSIQFETVLAGILKNEEPLENEMQELLQNKPTQNGIWISEQSRDKFLNILKDNGIDNYAINDDGYLYGKEENDNQTSKKLKDAIDSDKLYIIDISGTSYIRDDISGEIVEYPFEKMEPYQALDEYQEGNNIILEVTTNAKGKLSNQEILNEILLNLE